MDRMSTYYNKSTEEIIATLETSRQGLKSQDITRLRQKYGSNELVEGHRKGTLSIFIEQFKDFLVIILIVAAIISGALGKLESAVVIGIVIMINGILGTVQHVKAQKS